MEPRACLPPDSVVFRCPFTPCGRADLLCVERRCVAPCADRGGECPGGGTCTAREGDGALYCEPEGDVGLGGGCASGGDAACSPGLSCIATEPGDPNAVCSRSCADHADCAEACLDCEGEVACRRPRGGEALVCLPAPFGRGDESAGVGDVCGEHGDTDCVPGLDCVPAVGGGRACAARCDSGCPAAFVCAERGADGPHCLPGEAGGAGSPCPEGSGCDEVCVEGPPLERYCTVECPDGGCPEGFGCRDGLCRLGAEEAAPLGASCPEAGPIGCASGLCVVAPADGASVCSQRCDEAPCPDGFTCESLEAGRFCFSGAD